VNDEKSNDKKPDMGSPADNGTGNLGGSRLLARIQSVEKDCEAKGMVLDDSVDPDTTADAMFDMIRAVVTMSRNGKGFDNVVDEIAAQIHLLRIKAYDKGYKDGCHNA
jgi:hypothetical protein